MSVDSKALLFRGELFPIRDIDPQVKNLTDFLDEKGKSLKPNAELAIDLAGSDRSAFCFVPTTLKILTIIYTLGNTFFTFL